MQSQISSQSSIKYPERTIRRAKRALSCSPFQLALFVAMAENSVPLGRIADNPGINAGYLAYALSPSQIESYLMWLIKVGLLRREVDGQGITDSFRLTPLGRQLVAKYQSQGENLPKPRWWERILNTFSRWC